MKEGGSSLEAQMLCKQTETYVLSLASPGTCSEEEGDVEDPSRTL